MPSLFQQMLDAIGAWAATALSGSDGSLLLEAAFLLVAATYCLANFARCREAHCIVTGVGWAALAISSAVTVAAGRDVRDGARIAFLVIAVIGHGFEAVWTMFQGGNALRLASPTKRDS